MSRILVTGAAGLLGRFVVRELLAFERVRIEELGHLIRPEDKGEKDKIIGRLVRSTTW